MKIVKTKWFGTPVYVVRYNAIERIRHLLEDMKVKKIKIANAIEWKN